ncbi:MAG: hypothetical protein M3Y56_16545 [Armatimonadota bacterium]|nr:hypothetical protein [Armatimonadota bacterium]
MNKILTIAEIHSQFDSEWVLVAEPQTNESLEVQGGQVLYHNKNRDEFDRKVLEFHPKRFAVLFTGRPQENMEYVL